LEEFVVLIVVGKDIDCSFKLDRSYLRELAPYFHSVADGPGRDAVEKEEPDDVPAVFFRKVTHDTNVTDITYSVKRKASACGIILVQNNFGRKAKHLKNTVN